MNLSARRHPGAYSPKCVEGEFSEVEELCLALRSIGQETLQTTERRTVPPSIVNPVRRSSAHSLGHQGGAAHPPNELSLLLHCRCQGVARCIVDLFTEVPRRSVLRTSPVRDSRKFARKFASGIMRSPGPMRRGPRAAQNPQNGDLARSRTGARPFP
jgi:hypothetical protein